MTLSIRISKTRALIEKELRELRPWAILCAFLGLFDLLEQLFKQLDMQPLSQTIAMLGDDSGRALWMIAFAIGTGLGPREQEEGTLAFLDGIPVSRTRVLAVKLSVAIAMIVLAPTMSLFTAAGLHVLSHGSVDAALRMNVLLACYALQCAMIAHGVILGAAVGWLRSLTWLFTGMVTSVLAVAIDRVPRAALLSPLSLANAEITHVGLSLDWEVVAVQLGIALVALLLCFVGFARAGAVSQTRSFDLSRRPVLRAFVTTATALTLLTAVVLMGQHAAESDGDEDDEEDEGPSAPQFAPSPPAQTATAHYRISYPAVKSEQALALAAQADSIFERTHALLHVAPGASIDVDASGSTRNTEGTAYFGRIRLALGGDTEAVLAHETSHVITQRLAGAERDWLWREAHVLNEGLATWVEHHFTRDPRSRDSARLVLAALHTRRELILEELASLELLSARRDGDLKYPAGEAIIEAVVRMYGEAALPKLVRAFGEPKLPVKLRGLELWQATFQIAGFDLGAVIDEMFREIALDAEQRAAEIAALPRPRVRLVKYEGTVGVQSLIDVQHDAAVVRLRFKPSADSPESDYDMTMALEGQPVFRDDSEIQNGQICVQAGLHLGDQLLYEPWTCVPTRDAVSWQPPPVDAGDAGDAGIEGR